MNPSAFPQDESYAVPTGWKETCMMCGAVMQVTGFAVCAECRPIQYVCCSSLADGLPHVRELSRADAARCLNYEEAHGSRAGMIRALRAHIRQLDAKKEAGFIQLEMLLRLAAVATAVATVVLACRSTVWPALAPTALIFGGISAGTVGALIWCLYSAARTDAQEHDGADRDGATPDPLETARLEGYIEGFRNGRRSALCEPSQVWSASASPLAESEAFSNRN